MRCWYETPGWANEHADGRTDDQASGNVEWLNQPMEKNKWAAIQSIDWLIIWLIDATGLFDISGLFFYLIDWINDQLMHQTKEQSNQWMIEWVYDWLVVRRLNESYLTNHTIHIECNKFKNVFCTFVQFQN